MNNFDFKTYTKASDLPDRWNEISKDNYVFKRDFLIFLEKVNPCKQKYHICNSKNIILISYKLNLNIFTYKNNLNLNLPITIIGIPISISEKGYICDYKDINTLSNYIKTFPLALILNTDGELELPRGYTLSSYSLKLQGSFEDYLDKMRSHYRYRIKKAMKKANSLSFEKISPSDFNEEMYKLYEEVYNRSEGKLEKLSIKYFQQADAEIFVTKREDGKIIAFFQIFEYNSNLIFLFCGIDKTMNKKYDLYINVLLEIIKIAIKRKLKKVKFGQTTRHSKTILGAIDEKKYLHIASNFIPNVILNHITKKLGKMDIKYKRKVFKE